jgi:hypothetical protein
MDEVTFGNLIKNIGLVAGIVGLLLSLDLLFGAKGIRGLKKILDRSFNVDKLIITISSSFRRLLDNMVNFDEVVITTKARVIWGAAFLFISLLMIVLIAINR